MNRPKKFHIVGILIQDESTYSHSSVFLPSKASHRWARQSKEERQPRVCQINLLGCLSAAISDSLVPHITPRTNPPGPNHVGYGCPTLAESQASSNQNSLCVTHNICIPTSSYPSCPSLSLWYITGNQHVPRLGSSLYSTQAHI